MTNPPFRIGDLVTTQFYAPRFTTLQRRVTACEPSSTRSGWWVSTVTEKGKTFGADAAWFFHVYSVSERGEE